MRNLIISVSFYLSTIGNFIWAVVSFILYLVKDRPFDWFSVWGLIASIILLIVFSVLLVKEEIKKDVSLGKSKSGWSKRLEEAKRERDNNK